MAVVSVNELWPGGSGSDGIDRQRAYTRVFEVICDKATDDATVAGGPQARALGLPGNGYLYPLDIGAWATKIHAERSADSPYIWLVTVEYSTAIPSRQAAGSQQINPDTGEFKDGPTGRNPGTFQENPTDRPTRWRWRYEQTTELAVLDRRNRPILNCAGVPYDPPPEDEVSRAVITAAKNYPAQMVKFDWFDNFVNAVNSVAWLGRTARTLWCIGIDSGDVQQENGVSFREVVFTFKYNPKRWDLVLLEQGYVEMFLDTKDTTDDPSGTWKQRAITKQFDKYGRELPGPYVLTGYPTPPDGAAVVDPPGTQIRGIDDVQIPYVLNADGTPTAKLAARGKLGTSKQVPVYTRWRVKEEIDFKMLNL